MQACIAHSKLDMEEKPTLFMEFHGANERDVEEQTALVGMYRKKSQKN